MNWDIIEGNWKQVKGKVKEKWGKLTDSDLNTLSGKKDQLVGKIQERYGYTKDQAEREGGDEPAEATAGSAEEWPYRGPLLDLQQETRFHALEIHWANRIPAEDAATPVTSLDPLGVVLDRDAAVGEAIQPLLDRHAELFAGGIECRIAANHLVGGIAIRFAMILREQRQLVADRAGILRRRGMREAEQDRHGHKPTCPHRKTPHPKRHNHSVCHASGKRGEGTRRNEMARAESPRPTLSNRRRSDLAEPAKRMRWRARCHDRSRVPAAARRNIS